MLKSYECTVEVCLKKYHYLLRLQIDDLHLDCWNILQQACNSEGLFFLFEHVTFIASFCDQ